MARPSATDRVGRILAIVPWIADADGPRIEEVCARFGLTRSQLLDDLAVIPFVGRYPYTPENLIEVDIDDDRVWIRYTNFFERPLRLTRDEGLALLAAGTAAAGSIGHDPAGPLARGLAKVAELLGVDLEDDLRVVLGATSPEILDAVRAGVDAREVLDIAYYSHARDEPTERAVEPLRVFHTEGAWYLLAHCRRSDAERVFRVDRIIEVHATGEHFTRTATRAATEAFVADRDLPRVTLEVDAEGRWVADHYPVEARTELESGGLRVTLAVSAAPWLARVLLRLGPHGRVVEGPDELTDVGATWAARLLERYRS